MIIVVEENGMFVGYIVVIGGEVNWNVYIVFLILGICKMF